MSPQPERDDGDVLPDVVYHRSRLGIFACFRVASHDWGHRDEEGVVVKELHHDIRARIVRYRSHDHIVER